MPSDEPARQPPGSRFPATGASLIAAVLLGSIAGAFEVLNTSIGWHLAAGRWMLEHTTVLRFNPFTLTADSAPWLDHEWLFQVIAAVTEAVGGGPGLVVLRMAAVSALAFFMLRISHKAGLRPAPSLLLVAMCIYGARMRFFVRPELATLILTPLAVHVFLTRSTRSIQKNVVTIAAITILGVNLHGGILVLPVIFSALLAAELVREWMSQRNKWSDFGTGLSLLFTVFAASLANPWGYRVLAAPIKLAQLVGKDFIPNPEWISPGPGDVPELFVAIAAGAVLLSVRERDPVRWALFLVSAALALRYVRNVGLFFVLLPEALGFALAGLPKINLDPRWIRRLCIGTAAVVAALMIDARGFPFGFGYSADRYPVDACDFLEKNNLLSRPLYNDVRFGGWLIGRYYPPVKAFIDDRNEIHEEVLAEMWSIEESSSVRRWHEFLEEYDVATAVVRYRDPISVSTPGGESIGLRGHTALWFPTDQWALVYWDDIAMVLVKRTLVDPRWVASHEYAWVRPDDLDYLEQVAITDPEARQGIQADLLRRLQKSPGSGRAAALADRILK